MSQSFSPKKYFKKIQTSELLVKFYATHDIVALFEITDKTSRKTVTDILLDFYNSIPLEQKFDIERELTLIHTLSTKYSIPIFISLLKEKKIPHEQKEIECTSDEDKVLYYYLYHKNIFDEVMFFHDFYISRGYMLYEAKQIQVETAEYAITEFTKEFRRILNKEDTITEFDITAKILNGSLFVHIIFEGALELRTEIDKVTGELDRAKTRRKQEDLKIIYIPKDNEILISYTGKRYEKLIFLDTFLRIVCESHYEDKIESFDLSIFKKKDFDFATINKKIPLLAWKVKAVTFSFGNSEKAKKKIRLSLPSSPQENGLNPLFSTLEELKLISQLENFYIENVALSFSFTDKEKSDKSVNVSCSVSLSKSSLFPLFPYDTYARKLLKQSGIYGGFVEKVKKDSVSVEKSLEEKE